MYMARGLFLRIGHRILEHLVFTLGHALHNFIIRSEVNEALWSDAATLPDIAWIEAQKLKNSEACIWEGIHLWLQKSDRAIGLCVVIR